MADEVALLADDDLRSKLRLFNLPDGPITRTTRKMFERKLQRALKGDSEADEPDCTRQSIAKDTFASLELNHLEHASDSKTDAKLVSIFYGVCLQADEETITSPETSLVFTEKSEALLSVKKNSGARFKAFNNRNDAEVFAHGKVVIPSLQVSPVSVTKPVDPISNYKTPKPEEIVRFRKFIERGEFSQLSEMIYKNPKYLISSCDTPVILQEGFRYNALHVAAKAGKKDVCQLIISTLENDDFWKLLYPSDKTNMKDQHVNAIRKMFVLDMYLNTPDKGGCETPLHFACKFGKDDVVEYLLSCSATDKSLLNKYGETALQVTCTRVSDCPEELRLKIQNLFTNEDTVFVPILRSDDNCSSPKVGTPWSPSLSSRPEVCSDSPGEPRYRVSAYAGPMSPQKANNFCYTLKSPRATPEKQTKFRNIKRSDSEKGLERVARKLAKSQSVAWCEYWKFLDCFIDLSTVDGLTKLEEYLGAKKETYTSNAKKWNMLQTPDSGKRSSDSKRVLVSNDFVFEQEDGTKRGYEGRPNRHHTPTGRNLGIKGFRNRLQWDELKENDQPGVHENEGYDLPIKGKLNYTDEDTNAILAEPDGEIVCEDFLPTKDAHIVDTCHAASVQDLSEEKRQIKSDREEHVKELLTLDDLLLDEDRVSLNTSSCSEDSLLGLTSELKNLHIQDTPSPKEDNKIVSGRVIDEFPLVNTRIASATTCTRMTSDHIPLFIEGFLPSKVDLDVLRAIKSEKIDSDVFPNIYQWQKVLRSFSKSTRQAWPGPGSPRFNGNRRAISSTWSC